MSPMCGDALAATGLFVWGTDCPRTQVWGPRLPCGCIEQRARVHTGVGPHLLCAGVGPHLLCAGVGQWGSWCLGAGVG
eukprot:66241-Chlamydomonas_euryale.AAC.1